jgi:hypothetical protein
MIDLREHLQELADAAARHGRTPGPAAAVRRGRQRQWRIAGAVAAALAVAVAVGAGVTGHLAVQSHLPVTAPVTNLPPLPKLDLLSGSPAPPAEEKANATLGVALRRCSGGLGTGETEIGYFRSAELRRIVMISGKPPAAGETTFCWAVGVFDLKGTGWTPRPVKPVRIATSLTVTAEVSDEYGLVYGQVDARAVRVRVRFRDRPSLLEVPVIQTSWQYQVNLYVSLFGPGLVPVEVTAYDAQGHQLGGCSLPNCPGG